MHFHLDNTLVHTFTNVTVKLGYVLYRTRILLDELKKIQKKLSKDIVEKYIVNFPKILYFVCSLNNYWTTLVFVQKALVKSCECDLEEFVGTETVYSSYS